MESIEWHIHPLKENPVKSLLVGIIVAGMAYIIALWTGRPGWTLFYLLVFVFSLHKFVFFTHYVVDATGITIQRPWRETHYAYDQFRSVVTEHNGIQLNRFAQDSIYDRIRGIFLLTGDRHNEVSRILNQYLTDVSESNASE